MIIFFLWLYRSNMAEPRLSCLPVLMCRQGLIVGELQQLGCILPDPFMQRGIIAKLPLTKRDFTMVLKHRRETHLLRIY
jgi:hypothetical protein